MNFFHRRNTKKRSAIMSNKDYRNLCYRCASEARNAGFRLFRTKNNVKSQCWKCNRQGYEYIQKNPKTLKSD